MNKKNTRGETCIIGVSGMHCASCANTIEKKLSKQPGVINARVNFANEKAIVEYDSSKINEKSIADAINKTGYKAIPKESHSHDVDHSDHMKMVAKGEMSLLKKKIVIGAVLSAIIFIGSFPEWFGIQMNGYFLFFLATVVQFWVGWGFYRAAFIALKNKTTPKELTDFYYRKHNLQSSFRFWSYAVRDVDAFREVF